MLSMCRVAVQSINITSIHSNMNSLVEENYLKTLFSLSQSNGEVTVNDIAQKLHITMPTVTSMMKKLAVKRLITYASYQPIKLTAKGRKEAAHIIRKHRLTEMFLVQVMGFGWEEVHAIAEQIEHINHPPFFDKMDAMLGYPQFDPHGSAIPDKDGNVASMTGILLSTVSPKSICIVRAVVGGSTELLAYLNKCSIGLNCELTVLEREDFDKSLKVRVQNTRNKADSTKPKTITLSSVVCEHLAVEIIR